MNSNKVKAIATSVIAVILVGVILDSTYKSTNPENICKRFLSMYKKYYPDTRSAELDYLYGVCLK
ncbi:hypothetical protein N9U16_02700 [Prochlorococcus sp. AH-736-P10]|nr:hypothetical protein [Prochlorococcus sp. AH-736-P10]MDA9683551.1 hypothetical protein [Prochlorococcus sp. AH-736-P10]